MRTTQSAIRPAPRPSGRLLRYGIVATLGFVVQFAALGVFTWLGFQSVASTALAVEAAILHNFAWHDGWTWGDRRAPASSEQLIRLARYNAAMAATSIGVGIVSAAVLVEWLGRSLILANLVAIAAATVLNYLASDRMIFRVRPHAQSR